MDLQPGLHGVDSLLDDLAQLTQIAQTGVISRRELRLEPGEERNAAVLFLDVVGFTELARVLPSDHLARLIDRSFRIFELAVQGRGGYCDKVIGDAALYVFLGHPSYPPACESACRSALGILERVRQINATLASAGLAINVRCGIAYGHVTRQRVGGESQQVTVMGDTVNIAQRLENSAVPGTIQATIRVLDKTAGLVTSEPRGALELKGFGPVEVHVVTGIHEPELRLRTTQATLSPLVGRDALLDDLVAQAEAWLTPAPPDGPAAAPNRLLVLQGAAAVGKTRLAYELVNRLKARRPLRTASAHATPAATLTGFAGELCRVAGLTPDGLAGQWTGLTAGRPGLAEHLPVLALLLDSTEADTSGIRQATPADLLLACQLALQACVEAAGGGSAPVVLVVEDLQWLGALAPLLDHLLANTRTAIPLLVVGTARPEFELASVGMQVAVPVAIEAAPQSRAPELQLVELLPLGAADGTALLAALLPGVELPPQVAAELHDKAAGLPYYYEEFARMLVRRGIVEAVDGAGEVQDEGWTNDAPGPGEPRPAPPFALPALSLPAVRFSLVRELDELLIPDDVQMLVLGRLDMLEAELKELVLRASVLGRSFQYGLLSALEARLGFEGQDYPARLLAALTAEHVFKLDHPADAYFFEHLLTREAAYRALLPHNRRVLHSTAADVLAALHRRGTVDDWTQLPELARHLKAAERHAEAHTRWAELLQLAAMSGQEAQWDEWEAAALAELPPAEGGAPTSPSLELARAERILRGWDYPAARSAFERTLELARAAGDRRTEAAALRRLGMLVIQQDPTRSEALLGSSLAIMQELQDIGGEASVCSQFVNLYRMTQRFGEAESFARRGLDLARAANDQRAMAALYNNFGIVLQVTRNRLDEALDCYIEALALNRAVGNRTGEAINADNLGGLYYIRGDYALARETLELSIQRYGEVGDTPGVGSASGKLGLLLLRLGELEAAEATLLRSHAILAPLDEAFWQALTECYLGTLAAEREDWAGSRRWYQAARTTGAHLNDPQVNSNAAQGLVKAAIGLGDFPTAEAELAVAAGETERQGDPITQLQNEILRAQLELAQLQTAPSGRTGLTTSAILTRLDQAAESALAIGLIEESTTLRAIRDLQAAALGAA
jgi:class 3 adenylate cyclase/tetratricopeptide (TPR) repeat protein